VFVRTRDRLLAELEDSLVPHHVDLVNIDMAREQGRKAEVVPLMARSAEHTVTDLFSQAKHLFWDVEPLTIDPEKHSTFIIERILRFGLPEDVRVMLEQYSEATVRGVVTSSRRIDRKTANFWAIHLGIPREGIACFSTPLINNCFY
jgi:hypothetical protein